MPRISIILCTRNPRADYLEAVLAALRQQTLEPSAWELIVIDSASDRPLASQVDLVWHPAARVIRLDQPGLTPARLAGFAAAKADLLLMVDDDNVLAPDYLAEAVRIGEACPWVGAWGGNVCLVFEQSPPDWLERYRGLLAERTFDRVYWSNDYLNAKVPCGAGMVLRRAVAQAYQQRTLADPARQALDRSGDSLLSDGDTDLALTACDVGLGVGAFPSLTLQHLIPARRLTLEYINNLHAAMITSGLTLRALRPATRGEVDAPEGLVTRLRWWGQWARASREDRVIQTTGREAREEALKRLRERGLIS
ncbi:MAG: glycosyltransferase [Verrucomicrobiota bacterium JB022]|nr:glycosyltransferase [Verrucomicrobiota bacterium JB022]